MGALAGFESDRFPSEPMGALAASGNAWKTLGLPLFSFSTFDIIRLL
jgi:hypothetical protein